jgi:transposase-like protein
VSPKTGEKVSPMPRRCTVCAHLQRQDIDELLVSGAPYRSVAKRFGLSESAVYRHKTEHLPAHLLKARKAEEVAQADDLLEQVSNLQAHALRYLGRNAPEVLENTSVLEPHEEAAHEAAMRGDEDAYLEALRAYVRAGRDQALRVRRGAA